MVLQRGHLISKSSAVPLPSSLPQFPHLISLRSILECPFLSCPRQRAVLRKKPSLADLHRRLLADVSQSIRGPWRARSPSAGGSHTIPPATANRENSALKKYLSEHHADYAQEFANNAKSHARGHGFGCKYGHCGFKSLFPRPLPPRHNILPKEPFRQGSAWVREFPNPCSLSAPVASFAISLSRPARPRASGLRQAWPA